MAEVALNPNNGDLQSTPNHNEVSGYEQHREQRIKENLERMQKLGIVDLSLKVKSLVSNKRRNQYERRTPQRSAVVTPSEPVRRSSRLRNATPVSYVEAQLPKKEKSSNADILLEEGAKPEVYTEEHEKLLGSTDKPWTLFVDGYGADGKRIYDPVRGKTCHQCRQKTMGHRTHCSKCQMVQGQFCGDCLYIRYGENVLEAKQNSNWICPVCRGICNCSLCRQARGWPPTGTLYKKVASLGYKSVAHYLILTKRAQQPQPDENEKTEKNLKTPQSAKRSLPFTDIDGDSEESQLKDEQILGVSKESHQSNNGDLGPTLESHVEIEPKEMGSDASVTEATLLPHTENTTPVSDGQTGFLGTEAKEMGSDALVIEATLPPNIEEETPVSDGQTGCLNTEPKETGSDALATEATLSPEIENKTPVLNSRTVCLDTEVKETGSNALATEANLSPATENEAPVSDVQTGCLHTEPKETGSDAPATEATLSSKPDTANVIRGTRKRNEKGTDTDEGSIRKRLRPRPGRV